MSPWKLFSWPLTAHVAISETASSSLWVLQCSGQLLTLPRGKMEVCVCVCVCWRKSSKGETFSSVYPFLLSSSLAIITLFSFSTPLSMCRWWIKLIKEPQISSQETVCIHTCICIHTQSLMGAYVQAHTIRKKDKKHEKMLHMHELSYEMEVYMWRMNDIIDYSGCHYLSLFKGHFMDHFLAP